MSGILKNYSYVFRTSASRPSDISMFIARLFYYFTTDCFISGYETNKSICTNVRDARINKSSFVQQRINRLLSLIHPCNNEWEQNTILVHRTNTQGIHCATWKAMVYWMLLALRQSMNMKKVCCPSYCSTSLGWPGGSHGCNGSQGLMPFFAETQDTQADRICDHQNLEDGHII